MVDPTKKVQRRDRADVWHDITVTSVKGNRFAWWYYHPTAGLIAGVNDVIDSDFRNAPEPPRLVPFTYSTWPTGMVWVRRHGSSTRSLVFGADKSHIYYGAELSAKCAYENALEWLELSLDGGATWGPCGREEGK